MEIRTARCGHLADATYGVKGCQILICAGDRMEKPRRLLRELVDEAQELGIYTFESTASTPCPVCGSGDWSCGHLG